METNESIKYIEDVLENWENWQSHHKALTKALRDALSLINELTEGKYDIECSYNSLKKDNERLHASCTELERKCASLNDEIESLKDSNEHLAVFLAEAKADTVQKMQERIKAEKFHHKDFGDLVYLADIDRIANEMLEGENDNT